MIMAPDAYAYFSTSIQGALFIGYMLGSIVGEVFMSGRLGDWIVGTMSKKSKNKNPALRLWLAYPAALTAGVGYALWGVSIDKGWHWMTGEVALFLCEFIVALPLRFPPCFAWPTDPCHSWRWSTNRKHDHVQFCGRFIP